MLGPCLAFCPASTGVEGSPDESDDGQGSDGVKHDLDITHLLFLLRSGAARFPFLSIGAGLTAPPRVSQYTFGG